MEVILAIAFLAALWRIGTGLLRLTQKPVEVDSAATGLGDRIIPLPICVGIIGALVLAILVVTHSSDSNSPSAVSTITDNSAEIAAIEFAHNQAADFRSKIQVLRLSCQQFKSLSPQPLEKMIRSCDDMDGSLRDFEVEYDRYKAGNGDIERIKRAAGICELKVRSFQQTSKETQQIIDRLAGQ